MSPKAQKPWIINLIWFVIPCKNGRRLNFSHFRPLFMAIRQSSRVFISAKGYPHPHAFMAHKTQPKKKINTHKNKNVQTHGFRRSQTWKRCRIMADDLFWHWLRNYWQLQNVLWNFRRKWEENGCKSSVDFFSSYIVCLYALWRFWVSSAKSFQEKQPETN